MFIQEKKGVFDYMASGRYASRQPARLSPIL